MSTLPKKRQNVNSTMPKEWQNIVIRNHRSNLIKGTVQTLQISERKYMEKNIRLKQQIDYKAKSRETESPLQSKKRKAIDSTNKLKKLNMKLRKRKNPITKNVNLSQKSIGIEKITPFL